MKEYKTINRTAKRQVPKVKIDGKIYELVDKDWLGLMVLDENRNKIMFPYSTLIEIRK